MFEQASFNPNALQLSILRQLRMGQTDRAIARTLHVSERTIRKHVMELSALVGAQGRFALGAEVALRGWLSPDFDPLKDVS